MMELSRKKREIPVPDPENDEEYICPSASLPPMTVISTAHMMEKARNISKTAERNLSAVRILDNTSSTKLTYPTNFAKMLYLLLKAWYNVLSLFNLSAS